MLIDDAALHAVYESADGLLSGDLGNTLIIEMSTVLPKTTQELATKVHAAGGAFVECPVGGTIMPALKGQLLGKIGGDVDAVARARPVLAQLCRRAEHVGTAGAGATMKLAINLPLIVYWEALGEALSFAGQAGVDRGLAADILGDSSGAARVAPQFLPGIVDALDGDAPPATGVRGRRCAQGYRLDAGIHRRHRHLRAVDCRRAPVVRLGGRGRLGRPRLSAALRLALRTAQKGLIGLRPALLPAHALCRAATP